MRASIISRLEVGRSKATPNLRVKFLTFVGLLFTLLSGYLMLLPARAEQVAPSSVAVQPLQSLQPNSVVYNQLPRTFQLFPRSLDSNQATIRISGTVDTANQGEIIARTFAGNSGNTAAGSCAGDDNAHSVARQPLNYDGQGEAAFTLSLAIDAQLTNYQLEICLRTGNTETLERTVADLVAGDVYLIQGQSNANAFQRTGSASASSNEGPFVRSFGRRATSFNAPDEDGNGQSDDLDDIRADLQWHQAEGDEGQGSGAVGQWGIRLGRRLVDEFGIPIAILNNAVSGVTIAQHQRDDNAPERLDGFRDGGIYGRLLWRTRRAGVAESARALIWYQGESDTGNSAGHLAGFKTLYADWAADYPNLERIYVHQIRNVGTFCSGYDPAVREVQRRLADDLDLPKVRLMSTTGVSPQVEGCHFPYTNGYEKIGDNIFRLIARDLYARTDFGNAEPPNIDFAYFTSNSRNEVGLVMRNQADSLIWNSGAENDFAFSLGSISATSGRIENRANAQIVHAQKLDGQALSEQDHLLLTLNQGADSATTIDYVGHPGVNPPDQDSRAAEWVTNANGVGLLAFRQLPIAIDIPTVQLQASSELSTVPRGIPLSFGVSASDVDGIAQLRLLVNEEPVFTQTYQNSALSVSEQIEWTPQELGSFSVMAEARDQRNARQRGTVIELTVANQAPAITIAEPITGTTVSSGGGPLTVEATGADPDGSIVQVDLLVNGAVMETMNLEGSAGPWRFSWTLPGDGAYELRTRAIDNDGAVTDSAPIAVTVVTPTPTLIPTPLPTATATLIPTATPIPANTPTPVPTPTLVPSATPVPTGEGPIYVPIIVGGNG